MRGLQKRAFTPDISTDGTPLDVCILAGSSLPLGCNWGNNGLGCRSWREAALQWVRTFGIGRRETDKRQE